MKYILFLIALSSLYCYSQQIELKETDKKYSSLNITFTNVSDSLTLKHAISSKKRNNGFDSIPLPSDYNFNVQNGEIHTIWVENNSVHKGLFFTGGETPYLFEINLDLSDPDILRIYWNEDKKQYYVEELNYEELMAGFEK
jgi:hypothetical protein